MKNRLLDNHLQLNLELFNWRYRNQQVSFFSTNSAGGVVFRTDNIGRSTLKGFEVDSQFSATRNTTLRANVQYLDARNNEFVYQVFAALGPPNSGCTKTLSGSAYSVDCTGTRPTLTSKWTVSLGAEQILPLDNGSEFVLDVGTRYQSGYNTGFELQPSMAQSGYWMSDASITYNTADDNYFVSAFVRNIENNTPIAAAVGATQTQSYTVGVLRPPRTYGLRAGLRF